MPTHKARSTTSARLHQRTASGGSSKIGLNLHFTQKDVPPPKQQERLKRNGHSAVELHGPRNTSPYPKTTHLNPTHRVQSKERLQALQLKRAQTQTPLTGKRQQGTHKVDFSIARSDGTDEDEWVSSESGAATPLDNDGDDDDDETEERGRALSISQLMNEAVAHANGETPRAEAELHRVDTARPTNAIAAQAPPIQVQLSLSSPTSATLVGPPEADAFRPTRSEAPSPTTNRRLDASKRHSLIRNPSIHDSRVEMPPHPLIRRGQSYHGALKPAPLPLKVNAEAAQAQISSSPTFAHLGSTESSPSYMSNSTILESPTQSVVAGSYAKPTRKSSSSSLHSIATLPVPSSSRVVGTRFKQDRTRTLSTYSTSSMSAALNSLNSLPAMSRPGTPPLNVHFPTESRRELPDNSHQLLPPPFLSSHLTILSRCSPLGDCFDRVARAKRG